MVGREILVLATSVRFTPSVPFAGVVYEAQTGLYPVSH